MLTPLSEPDLSDMIRAATGPLRIIGGGTRDYGPVLAGHKAEYLGILRN